MELAVPLWVMLAVAALSALIAIAVGCTLVEGIVLSAILGLVLWVALSLPFPVWVQQLVLSGGIGSISGLIAAGVYGDFFASRTVEYAGPQPPAGRRADDEFSPDELELIADVGEVDGI